MKYMVLRECGHEIVEARELKIDYGCLVFITHGEVIASFKDWISVHASKQEEKKFDALNSIKII